ncbi:hypothetical protein [Streptomyces sp. Ac-502]|uniref:hypothetical protein n=1 Tax=Streptomyces sp. Ac-502 TaxID=3342801 RepID=UPI003862BAB0
MRDQIRSVLRWPLYSPRRLAAVLTAAVALLFLLNACNDKQRPADPKPAAAPSTAPRTSTPAPSASAAPSASPDMAAALDTARAFVTAWASHKEPAAWLAGVQPQATPASPRSCPPSIPAVSRRPRSPPRRSPTPAAAS